MCHFRPCCIQNQQYDNLDSNGLVDRIYPVHPQQICISWTNLTHGYILQPKVSLYFLTTDKTRGFWILAQVLNPTCSRLVHAGPEQVII